MEQGAGLQPRCSPARLACRDPCLGLCLRPLSLPPTPSHAWYRDITTPPSVSALSTEINLTCLASSGQGASAAPWGGLAAPRPFPPLSLLGATPAAGSNGAVSGAGLRGWVGEERLLKADAALGGSPLVPAHVF